MLTRTCCLRKAGPHTVIAFNKPILWMHGADLHGRHLLRCCQAIVPCGAVMLCWMPGERCRQSGGVCTTVYSEGTARIQGWNTSDGIPSLRLCRGFCGSVQIYDCFCSASAPECRWDRHPIASLMLQHSRLACGDQLPVRYCFRHECLTPDRPAMPGARRGDFASPRKALQYGAGRYQDTLGARLLPSLRFDKFAPTIFPS